MKPLPTLLLFHLFTPSTVLFVRKDCKKRVKHAKNNRTKNASKGESKNTRKKKGEKEKKKIKYAFDT